MNKTISFAIYAVCLLIGIGTFFYPFFLPIVQTSSGDANRVYAPFLTIFLLIICLTTLLTDLQGQAMSAKIVALLGTLIALISVMRFIETAIPGPAGFTPIFAPIIIASYLFGSRWGFLLGALTMATSALITGGVGIWLPYQMFAAGGIGFIAGALPKWSGRRATVLLTLYGIIAGFGYGALLNLYFWPFTLGDPSLSWSAELGFWGTIQRYAIFYAATSLWWDAFGAAGNALLISVICQPMIRVLERFRHRFYIVVEEQ